MESKWSSFNHSLPMLGHWSMFTWDYWHPLQCNFTENAQNINYEAYGINELIFSSMDCDAMSSGWIVVKHWAIHIEKNSKIQPKAYHQWDHLLFMMGIPILLRQHLYIASPAHHHFCYWVSYCGIYHTIQYALTLPCGQLSRVRYPMCHVYSGSNLILWCSCQGYICGMSQPFPGWVVFRKHQNIFAFSVSTVSWNTSSWKTSIFIANTVATDDLRKQGVWGINRHPDSKVHGANMRPIWGRQDPGGPHVGHMNLAIWCQG